MLSGGLCAAEAKGRPESVGKLVGGQSSFIQHLVGAGGYRLVNHALDEAVGVNHDRNFAKAGIFAENSQDIPSVCAGEEQVEEDRIGLCGSNSFQAGRAVAGKLYFVTGFGEPVSKELGGYAVVFDDQNLHAKRRSVIPSMRYASAGR